MSIYIKNSDNSTAKKQQPASQMGRGAEFLQIRHTVGWQRHVKIFTIIDYKGNANQYHNELPPHTLSMAVIKKMRNSKCWKACVKKEAFFTLQKWKLEESLWKTLWRFLKKLKNRTPIRSTYFWLFGVPHVNDLSKQ